MSSDYAVIIATVGRPTIKAVLASLEHGTEKPVVVAIGNQSGRNLDLDITSYAFDVVVVPSVGGISRARNDALGAISEYGYDWTLYPNDDSIFGVRSLEELSNAIADLDNPAAIAGTLLDGHRSRFQLPPRGTCLDRRTVWFAVEPATAISRRAIEMQEYPFDQRIGTGSPHPWQSGEGTDLLLRILEQGGRVGAVPEFAIEGAGERRDLDSTSYRRKMRAYARGTGLLYRRHRYPASAKLRVLLGPWFRLLQGQAISVEKIRLAVAVTVGRLEGLLEFTPRAQLDWRRV